MSFPVMGESMDELVAKHVFGWPQEALDCTEIPLPPYSTCDKAVGAVLCKLRDDQRFNELLVKHLDDVAANMTVRAEGEEWGWRKRPALVSFYADPHSICVIALEATDLPDGLSEISQTTATCHQRSEISGVQGDSAERQGRSI